MTIDFLEIAKIHGAKRPRKLSIADYEALVARYRKISDEAHSLYLKDKAGEKGDFSQFTVYLAFSSAVTKITTDILDKIYAKIGRFGGRAYQGQELPGYHMGELLSYLMERLTYYSVCNAFHPMSEYEPVIAKLVSEIEQLQSYIGVYTPHLETASTDNLFGE